MSDMKLFPYQAILQLTNGTVETFEYTAYGPESAARGSVANFQKQNPTKRVDYLSLFLPGETRGDGRFRKWLPHLEGWEDEQPDFIKADRRDGLNPADGTEI